MRFEVADGEVSGEVLLFRNVSNAGHVRSKLMSGELDAAIIDASLVVDMFQVLVAANMAAEKRGSYTAVLDSSLASRNVNTEILYNLSATRNIGKALKAFGITAASDYVLAVVMNSTAGKVEEVRDAITGAEVADVKNALREHADKGRICSQYGIEEKELTSGSLLDSVVTRIACRDIL